MLVSPTDHATGAVRQGISYIPINGLANQTISSLFQATVEATKEASVTSADPVATYAQVNKELVVLIQLNAVIALDILAMIKQARLKIVFFNYLGVLSM